MNKYLSSGLIFCFGAIVGGAVSWFVCKKQFENKLEQEIDKNRDYYKNLHLQSFVNDNPFDTNDDNEENSEDNEDNEEKDKSRPISNLLRDYTKAMDRKKEELLKRERTRYDKIPPVELEVDEIELAVNNDHPAQDICIINADQFAHDCLGYEKTTLLWWKENNLLTTEDFDILDIPEVIGSEWKDRIGEFERDAVYVRNKVAETDYEIIQQYDSYYDYQG